VIDLYYMPGAASLVVHGLLEELGAEYRLVRVTKADGKVDPPELVELNPHARVPTMVDGDLVMYEAAACVMHLCDAHPEAGLAPALGTAERALWYRALTYMTNTVQATFMIRFVPRRYTDDEAGVDAVCERAATSLARMRDVLEGELAASAGPYLVGERFSSADLFLAMMTRWGRRLPEKWWDQPLLGAHYRLVIGRPAIQRVYEQEGLTE
jgi:glutathione S-transferase